jgi:hypothetical protein
MAHRKPWIERYHEWEQRVVAEYRAAEGRPAERSRDRLQREYDKLRAEPEAAKVETPSRLAVAYAKECAEYVCGDQATRETVATRLRKRVKGAGEEEPNRVDCGKLATATGQSNGATAAEPLEPTKAYLTSWGEILAALKLKTSDKNKVTKLNAMHDGPILMGGRGEQPTVERSELIAWHEGLAVRLQEIRKQRADRQATAVDGYEYGKDGAVAFGGSGSVKNRRRDRKP